MPDQQKTDNLYTKLEIFGEKRGYLLNPDVDFAKALVESLVVNEERYGYEACPCRLATGERAEDRDIICPCDYRDADLTEFGACYCGLYVNQAIFQGKQTLKPIPERRKPINERQSMAKDPNSELETQNSLADTSASLGQAKFTGNTLPVWRCTVCGYLCARDDAPEICPICGATHDRFEKF